MESVPQRAAPRVVPSSADWSRLRPMITHLYQIRRYKMVEVRNYLQSIGYHVNTRMVRARITQWNLQKNLQARDMAAALRLLGPDPATWPSPEPCFLIRGRRVSSREILQILRRKGVQDPFQWAQSNVVGQKHTHVVLLDTETAAQITLTESDATVTSSSNRLCNLQSSSVPKYLLTTEQKAVANLHDYCSAYVGLGRAAIHQEPQVHQFTVHGRFGNFMQEGLAQMMRRDPGAFPNFHRGFDLVQPLLSDCHPMSLAQFLAVTCELAASNDLTQGVLASLLRHATAIASSLKVSQPVIDFLLALQSTPDTLHVAISSLRAALGAFMAHQSIHWQRLYIQERLCDCLYHGKERTEGSSYRASLLQDQQQFYGLSARNVLWTLTNVADDQLHLGNVDGGQRHYSMALTRADELTGFARAKIRFAALDGLARTAQARAAKIGRNSQGTDQVSLISCLQDAYRNIDGALNEALTWFDPSSRRVSRSIERRTQISDLLHSLGHNPMPTDFVLVHR